MSERRVLILADIVTERERQIKKWGEHSHRYPEWISLLTEEVGEAATEANKANWATELPETVRRMRLLRNELVQVGAVCVQILEDLDHNLSGFEGRFDD